MKKRVLVIGGGASGIVAAINAARHGAVVSIFEHQDKIGKKILLTGNGKCNLTNLCLNSSNYVTTNQEDKDFISDALKSFSPQQMISFFHSIGLRTTVLRDSYVYPETEAAFSVVSALLRELKKLHVEILTNQHVSSISPKDNRICIISNNKTFFADSVIISCGGKSYPKTGSDGSGFDILKQMHLHFVEPYPALTSLICNHSGCKTLAGMRNQACVSILASNHSLIASNQGQIQFTDYGLSGIPVFQVSSQIYPYLMKHKNTKLTDLTAKIDLFPYLELDELFLQLKKQLKEYQAFSFEEAMNGFLHKKWIQFFASQYGISNKICECIEEDTIKHLAHAMKNLQFPIKDLKGFDFCQVTGGGLELSKLNPNFELKKYPSVFVTGELLNITGDCGGYNLHWAFLSGLIAGKEAAKLQDNLICLDIIS